MTLSELEVTTGGGN